MSLTAHDMIMNLFNVKTRPIHSQVNVSNTLPPTEIAPNNPNRLSLIVSNPSGFDIYVQFDHDFIAGEGILIKANGGVISLLWSDDMDTVGWSLHGLASGGVAVVNVLEIVSI